MITAGWLDELRYAVRALVRRPGYFVVATATLALGIGCSIAIFAVVYGVLLGPLPYPGSERIVVIDHHAPGLNLPNLSNSEGTIAFYREAATQITRMAPVSNTAVNLTGAGPAERIAVERVTPEFFDVIGTRPALGRAITEADVAQGAPGVIILTHAAWQARFGADPAAVGRFIDVDGAKTEIVGVMPAGFAFPDPSTQALLPLYLDAQGRFGAFGFRGLARLSPGATLETAGAELNALQSRLPARFSGTVTEDFLKRAGWSASIATLHAETVRDVAATLWVLLAGVGLLLAIATANVANLFLVRAESRGREMALRAALGAGRGRMAATFLAESIVVAIASGLIGIMVALAGVKLLVAYGPPDLPRLHEVRLSVPVLGFAALVTIIASFVVGGVPIAALRRRARTGASAQVLREGGRSATIGRTRNRARKVLIAAQLAMSLVLLVGAQLMLASVRHLRDVDPGFRSAGVLTVGVSLSQGTSDARAAQFYQRIVEEAALLPGVRSAGVTNSLPIERNAINGSSFEIQSRPRPEDALPPVAYYATVTQGYFDAMGIRLLAGRAPEWRDALGNPRVIWVNETFARQFLDGKAPGERVRFGSDTAWSEIVGVVGDVRHNGLREDIPPMAFHPMGVTASGVENLRGQLVVHVAGDAGALAQPLRAIIERTDPTVPVISIRPMHEVIAASVAQSAFTMTLLTVAALVAIALGVVGLYGVISYVVGQRTNEIGIRIALGARPGQIRRMVVAQGLVVAAGGIAIGVVAAVGVTRLMQSLLFEVSARDPWVIAGSAFILVLVSVAASDLPARRAASVEPVDALRSD
jgi:putative ABC transport system permease protein